VPSSASLAGFIAAALVVLAIPGPAVLYILTRSLSQGRRAGLVSVLGLSTGALVHVAAATVGLSAILLTSATAFTAVKLLGAGYLIYLGVRTLVGGRQPGGNPTLQPHATQRIFTEGVLVSILNPKIAIFFLAFLPQFVDPSRGPVPRQILFLGLLYVGLALITDSVYALLAGSLRHWLRDRVPEGALPRYASGLLYIGLGIGTAIAGRRN
jgi:threonine/homoserine/homoserine lactone efflux protein